MQWGSVDLRVEVRDSDRFTKESFMGWAALPLDDVVASTGDGDTWLHLQPREDSGEVVRGQVKIRACLVPPDPIKHTTARVTGLYKALVAGNTSKGSSKPPAKSSGYGQTRPAPRSQGGGRAKPTFHKVDWSHVKPKTVSQPAPARPSRGRGVAGHSGPARSGLPVRTGRGPRARSIGRGDFVVGRVFSRAGQGADEAAPAAPRLRRPPPPAPSGSRSPAEQRAWEKQLRGGSGHTRGRSSSGAWADGQPEVDRAGAVEYMPSRHTHDDPALWISADDIRAGMAQEAARVQAHPASPSRAAAFAQAALSFPPPPPACWSPSPICVERAECGKFIPAGGQSARGMVHR